MFSYEPDRDALLDKLRSLTEKVEAICATNQQSQRKGRFYGGQTGPNELGA